MTSLSTQQPPMTEGDITTVADQFFRDGFAIVPDVLGVEECELLRRKADEIFDNRATNEAFRHSTDFVVSNPLLHDRIFADMFVREPILSMVEAILGKEARFCGQTIIRNQPGTAITTWHVDDCNVVDFPLPDDILRHDARIRLPVYWLTVQLALTDIETLEDGPTEVVPASHYAGRLPNSQQNPHFDGRGPTPVFCKAGDMYLLNQQVWHRGGPNTSQRTRYLLALQYAQGGTRAVRFQGLEGSPQLDRILEGADQHMLRVLGRTPPTYGVNL